MPVKKQPPAAPKLEAIETDKPRERKFRLRGVKYHLVELSAVEYEKCLKLATEERDGRSVINNQTLFRVMLGQCMLEPKIDVEAFMKKPYATVRYVNDVVDDLHYSPEEVEDLTDEDEDDEGEAEG